MPWRQGDGTSPLPGMRAARPTWGPESEGHLGTSWSSGKPPLPEFFTSASFHSPLHFSLYCTPPPQFPVTPRRWAIKKGKGCWPLAVSQRGRAVITSVVVAAGLRIPRAVGPPSPASAPQTVLHSHVLLLSQRRRGVRKATGSLQFSLKPIHPGGRGFIIVSSPPFLSSEGFHGAKASTGANVPPMLSDHAGTRWAGPILGYCLPFLETFPL